jgi:maltose alpha-D-glucosyltransferase / alpha-amylase
MSADLGSPARRRARPRPSVSRISTPIPRTAVLGDDPEHWYKDAVIYELHLRAFQDSDGDGIGDLAGLITRLDYLQDLGATALWLLPFYPSPLRDDGYDISDYRGIHPPYGTLRDFRTLLREAHRRGMRVITELVLAHTSDEHPWFQRARRSAPGSMFRDYYMWSDTPEKFADARVIFKDFESSNWSYDPVAHSYFWHRFYYHQPSLNYDNPAVRQEMFDVVDYWLGMGVDGLRLDAVPYLYAREGTTCENLPETYQFLRELRAHIDRRFSGRMLLAEANQWPEDAIRYLGDGDECHMAFHFPLMPRMFMAARQEDRYPIVDILAETPPLPDDCQWALFLRNHDELTLEMVTDEERDYMYRVYAQDPQARINVGIRRRLAPLLGNNRSLIEMMNGLLFSLPGTPIIYYGDEIGMGDNIYLGDRNAVRTPMQWSGDINAGFSRANPQRLFLPVIIDPAFQPQSVNVDSQNENTSSLLWWMKRLIAQRNRYRAFSRGTLQMLFPENRKVLAFLRCYGDEKILVVVNLSRFAQAVELELSDVRGSTPVELFGATEFPQIGELPYFITLGPHGFYWFSLESKEEGPEVSRLKLRAPGTWESVFGGSALLDLEDMLTPYLAERRWFGGKSLRIRSVELFEAVPIHDDISPRRTADPPRGVLALMGVELEDGTVSTYVLPVAFACGVHSEEICKWHPETVICGLHVSQGPGDEPADGVLFDATWEPRFSLSLLDAVVRRRQLRGHAGRLVGIPAPDLRQLVEGLEETTATPMAVEQSNTSIAFGSRVIGKILRRVEPGIHPGVEMTRFLTERAGFTDSPVAGGHLEYRPDGIGSEAVTVATFEEFVPNEGDGWGYVVDSLARGMEDVAAAVDLAGLPAESIKSIRIGSTFDLDEILGSAGSLHEAAALLIGPHIEWSALLGLRTAEMHQALVSDTLDPAFAPELLTAIDRRAMMHAARINAKRSFRTARPYASRFAAVNEVLDRGDEVLQRLAALGGSTAKVSRIRCHGDYHLGQVLWTGRDFVLIDFDGEPSSSLAQRRRKRPALVDVAGMLRSFQYASRAAALRVARSLSSLDEEKLEPWLALWYKGVSGTFLTSYLNAIPAGSVIEAGPAETDALLEFFLFDKALYELDYEANNRPDWIEIPARGILGLLGNDP